MAKRNYYNILGVEPNASQEEIRSSYILRSRVLHPDRFDPEKQHEEWAKANEMLAQLNEAYSVLRDPKKRASYDASVGVNTGDTKSNDRQTYSEASSSSKANSNNEAHSQQRASKVRPSGASHFTFSELPASIQQRLLERQRGKISEQFKLKTGSYLHVFGFSSLAILWFPILLKLADNNKWSSSQLTWFSIITVLSVLLIWRVIRRMYKWHTTKLKPHIYVTPLYYIKTTFDDVWFWWFWDVKDYKVVHNYQNNSYTDTTVTLIFEDSSESFTLKGQSRVKQLWETLAKWEAQYKRALANRDMDYFLTRDDFVELHRDGKKQESLFDSPSETTNYKRYVGYASAALFGLALMVLAYNVNLYFDDKRSWDAARVFDKASAYRNYLNTHPSGRWRENAQRRIAALYDASANRYTNELSRGFDTPASEAILDVLSHARESGDYRVIVAFARQNQIPAGIEEQLKRRHGVRNILPIGNSFSEANMQSRERYLLDTIKSAFASVIPEDVLEFNISEFNENRPVFLITYTVKASDSLYYRDLDGYLPVASRPFYPGISFDWNFEIRLPSEGKSYEFRLNSKPADSFSYSGGDVYDGMSQSAFNNLRDEIVRRLGLRRQ